VQYECMSGRIQGLLKIAFPEWAAIKTLHAKILWEDEMGSRTCYVRLENYHIRHWILATINVNIWSPAITGAHIITSWMY